MNPDVAAFAQVLVFIVGLVATPLVIAKVAHIAFRQPKQPSSSMLPPGVDEARFARLENAVETIAVEVERIAEAQRFAMKLQAGRGEAALPAPRERATERSRERVTTPLP